MVKNIIFDVDGTLWDCSETVAHAWNDVYAKRRISRRFTARDVTACMGLRIDEISEKLLSDTEPALRKQIVDDCIEAQNRYLFLEGGNFYPGAKETLKALSEKYGLYIVSNCTCGYIESMLAFSGLGDVFSGFLCAGMTGKDKGENLKILMREHSLKQCVYVGDTLTDERACQEAGIPFVWAAYGFGKSEHFAASVRFFPEIKDAVEAL